jgi:hypothetical protein
LAAWRSADLPYLESLRVYGAQGAERYVHDPFAPELPDADGFGPDDLRYLEALATRQATLRAMPSLQGPWLANAQTVVAHLPPAASAETTAWLLAGVDVQCLLLPERDELWMVILGGLYRWRVGDAELTASEPTSVDAATLAAAVFPVDPAAFRMRNQALGVLLERGLPEIDRYYLHAAESPLARYARVQRDFAALGVALPPRPPYRLTPAR